MTSVEEADAELKRWFWWASHSRIPVMQELGSKVKRHKDHILKSIQLGLSNARIEARGTFADVLANPDGADE